MLEHTSTVHPCPVPDEPNADTEMGVPLLPYDGGGANMA
jgi:energy-converting hydrogenase Eha subunit F